MKTASNDVSPPDPNSAIASIALASVLGNSMDCVKLIGLDGTVGYMNGNGLCAMEIDDFTTVQGQPWALFWPTEALPAITASFGRADAGETVRFKAFCPTAKGSPRWWEVSVSAVSDALGNRAGYLAVSRDVTEVEVSREALEVAASELKHRLANTYAMISGLLRGFARGETSTEKFADEMSERLTALSRAQSMFVTKDAPCEVGQLIPALLEPFERPSCPIVIQGSTQNRIDQGQADAVALTIGELAVNSSKHGALAHSGEIRVDASDDGQSTRIVWVERSDRAVQHTSREGGQGLRVMNRIVSARRGKIVFDWDKFGPTVIIVFQGI